MSISAMHKRLQDELSCSVGISEVAVSACSVPRSPPHRRLRGRERQGVGSRSPKLTRNLGRSDWPMPLNSGGVTVPRDQLCSTLIEVQV